MTEAEGPSRAPARSRAARCAGAKNPMTRARLRAWPRRPGSGPAPAPGSGPTLHHVAKIKSPRARSACGARPTRPRGDGLQGRRPPPGPPTPRRAQSMVRRRLRGSARASRPRFEHHSRRWSARETPRTLWRGYPLPGYAPLGHCRG